MPDSMNHHQAGDGHEPGEDPRRARHPAPPLRPDDQVDEALGSLEVVEQQREGDAHQAHRDQPTDRHGWRREGEETEQQPERQHREHAGGRALGDDVERDRPVPGDLVLSVVGDLHHLARLHAAHVDGAGARRTLALGVANGGTGVGHGRARRGPGRRAQVDVGFAWMELDHVREEEGARRALPGRGVLRRVVTVDVEQLGRRALLGLADDDVLLGEHAADLRLGIVQIASDDRVLGADHDAGWLEPDVHTMCAVVALGRGARVRVDVDGVVRARLQTGLAADADVRVELHDPVVPLVHRGDGTAPHAGRIRAVVAAGDLEMAAYVRVDPGLGVLHPGAVDPQRHLVLALARRRARMTADARPRVDDESVVHAQPSVATRLATSVPLGACYGRGPTGWTPRPRRAHPPGAPARRTGYFMNVVLFHE